MFERFTDRARRVVVLAQEHARETCHNYIGSEHLLLALLSEGEGIAAQALRAVDVVDSMIRRPIMANGGEASPSGHIPYTPNCKKVLEFSLREALQLGHNYIGTEHLLLGLIREGGSTGAKILVDVGVDPAVLRKEVMQLVAETTGTTVHDLRHRLTEAAAAYDSAVRRRIAAEAQERAAAAELDGAARALLGGSTGGV